MTGAPIINVDTEMPGVAPVFQETKAPGYFGFDKSKYK